MWLYRLFGVGKLPSRSEYEREGIVVAHEGMSGSVTYRDFRSPNLQANFRRQWMSGSVVVTRGRFVGFMFRNKLFDVPFDSKLFEALEIQVQEGQLLISFDVSEVHADWKGTMECRYKTPQAEEIAAAARKAFSDAAGGAS